MKPILSRHFSEPLSLRKGRKSLLLLSLFLSALLFGQTPRQTANSYRSAFGPNALIGYYAYVPPGYAANPTQSYPLMIFLHGAGEKAWNPQDLNNLPLVKLHGPPKLIDQGQDFPFIVISPQCPFAGWDEVTIDNWNTNVYRPGQLVDEILEKVKTLYRVDNNRIYITGLSMGGAGTFSYAAYYPHKVAAAIPIAGWPTMNNACAVASNNTAIWAFQGSYDNPNNIVAYINDVNACNPAPNATSRATIYPGVGHDSWTQTYNNTGPGIAPDNIYNWLLAHSKAPVGNQAPVANAGVLDKSFYYGYDSTLITGTGTDVDGTIVNYTWTQISGPSAIITSTGASLRAYTPAKGTYVFRLTVTDNSGATAYDDVTVHVKKYVSGLNTEYFSNTGLSGTPIKTTSSDINFDWANGAPITGISNDNFSTRWSGKFINHTGGPHTFYTSSDDGVRVYLNGNLIINNWTDHGPIIDASQPINIEPNGVYDLVVEYYEKAGGATAKLFYTYGVITSMVPVHPNHLFRESQTTTPQGTGLLGQYFSNSNLTGTAITRVDSIINFNWNNANPITGISADYFSVRWTGKIKPDYSELYTFYTLSDDGIRLFVNGQEVINNWTDHGTIENSGTIALTAGQLYDIRLEYYEKTGGAVSTLSWSSASQGKSIIAPGNLYAPGSFRTESTTDSDEHASTSEALSLFPVPALNHVNVLYSTVYDGDVQLQILDEMGNQVQSMVRHTSQGPNNFELDVSALQSGIYALVITGANHKKVSKLMIAK